jgi:hypothetical protein
LFDDVITSFPVIGKPTLQKVGEKKQFQYGEHDKQLDKDDDPKPFPDSHTPKTIIIKTEHTVNH